MAVFSSTWALEQWEAPNHFLIRAGGKGQLPAATQGSGEPKSQRHSGRIKEAQRKQKEIKSILSDICFAGIYKRLKQLLPKFELMSREKSFQEVQVPLFKLFGTVPFWCESHRAKFIHREHLCAWRWREGEHNKEAI